jgi:DegV family protein with EDD domain
MLRSAVVTDSTATLPAEVSGEIAVVPLTVVIDGVPGREGVDVSPGDVAAALVARRPVSTSRPTPEDFAVVYERVLSTADRVLSIHLASKLSGACDSARLAAKDFGERVVVLDSGSGGMGLGFPAVAAYRAAAEGADPAEVLQAAETAMRRTTTLFYVDTLDHMRRGGRISTGSAMVGSALAVKPILGMSDGVVVLLDKVRTASRALARVVERAVAAAGGSTVDIAVQHVSTPERAAALVDGLKARLTVREWHLGEVSAALAAHAGPGLVSAVVHRVGDE